MINLGGLDILTSAQGLLENSAQRISHGPPVPEDVVNLLKAREQFTAGTKLIQTEDELTKRLLDVVG